MPADVNELQKLIKSPEFQSLGPQDQLANFRNYLSDHDEEYAGIKDAGTQSDIARKIIDYHSPGLMDEAADVAEYIPVVGGAVHGARNDTVRPLTGALFGQPESTAGRMFAEAGRDVGELAAAEGVTKLAMPAINALARRVVGRGLEDAIAEKFFAGGAEGLVDASLTAGSTTAAKKFAGEAARLAIRERWAKGALEQLPAATLFGASAALEGEIQNGELPPLSDILATSAGAAAIGLGIMGGGELMRKFRLRGMDEIVGAASKFEPERFKAVQRQVGEIADAVARASSGRLDHSAAADLTLTALTEPITSVGDVKTLKDALRARPELLGTEPGLRILRTQRTITAPEVLDVPGPYLRVTYDDEQGVTKTLDLREPEQQKEFAKRVSKGDIVVDHVVGDNASVLRAGIRPGEPLEMKVTAGGGPSLTKENTPSPAFEAFYDAHSVPALRPEPVNPGFADLVDQAAREIRSGGNAPGAPHDVIGHPRTSALDAIVEARPAAMPHAESATSVEAINRLASEKGAGVTFHAIDARSNKERVIPSTVDRVDVRPAPHEIIVKRGGTPKDVIVEAGAKVSPQKVRAIRTREEKRFSRDVTQREVAAQSPLALPPPNIQQGTLTATGRVFSEPIVAPPQGVVTKASTGADVKVVTHSDAIGRAIVEMPDGRRVQAQWDARLSHFEIPESLLDLPERPVTVPQLTGEGAAVSPKFTEQLQPGQVLAQTVQSLGKRGARPSIEVLAVDGDKVLLRSGDNVIETDAATVARTVQSGDAQFVFDMATSKAERVITTMRERFRSEDVFTRTEPAPTLTTEQLARDRQLAETLYTFETQHAGQIPSAATLSRDTNAGIDAKAAEAKRVPPDKRTKGGSRLVKGCAK